METDRNGFTTALVLRALRDVPAGPVVDRLRSAALDFVERCRSPDRPGAFAFWPDGRRPVWAPHVPADVDDTAVMTVELIRHKKLRRRDGQRTVCHVLLANRVTADSRALLPPWIVPGAFYTWIGGNGRPNVVDCCVNANAAALMAVAGTTHLPGYREAIDTVLNGIEWAGADARRQQSITPFYPSLHELCDAVEHAVECGVQPLRPALQQLRDMDADSDASAGFCCSAYGGTVWHCAGLEEARSLRAGRAGARMSTSARE
jgi:hypothetical protein